MKAYRKIGISAFIVTVWACLAMALSAFAQLGTAPDATTTGPYGTTSAEYRFAATIDGDIIAGRATELWARVYRPTDLSGGTYPLLVLLHGNHATCGIGSNPRRDTNCQYTTSGSCPAGYVVVPNHMGYGYLADRLASWGYVVVSINANRGITCGSGVAGDSGLNLARGRLVLKHLQRLSEWNTNGGTPASLGVDLRGKLDFNSVGLLGHSRGGEGVRAAYNLYRDSGSPWPGRIPDAVNIQAIFEIGAVDGQTSRVLNADGTVWNQLLPMCDGDVSDLQGVKPFDRMMAILTEDAPTQKSTFTVWGANHNYYNTEWQTSDSGGCFGPGNIPLFSMPVGSPAQRQTSLASALALFRGNVGPAADPTFNQNFNPQYTLPAVVTDVTRVDRAYTDSPNSAVTLAFDDMPTSATRDSNGITLSFGAVPNHAPQLRAAQISWNSPGGYFLTNGTGGTVDVNTYQTLEMRLSRQNSGLNPTDPTNFSISLVGEDGALYGPVQLSDYADVRGPVGGPLGRIHPILQTARIPVADFGIGVNIAGVQLTFDGTGSGAIYLTNIRFSTVYGLTKNNGAAIKADSAASSDTLGLEDHNDPMNVINRIQTVASAESLDNQTGVEIELVSNKAFPVQDELVTLRIGDQEFVTGRYPESGDTQALIFTLTADEFARAANGDPVTVQYGRGQNNGRWIFSRLDKGLLK